MEPVDLSSILPGVLSQSLERPPSGALGKPLIPSKDKTAPGANESALTFVSANFERMPVYFLCSSEERERLETQARQNNQPIELVSNNKGEKLSISPSGSYGLPTGFDMDVMTVIHHKIHESCQILDECPSILRLWISEFPKIMQNTKSGQLYQNIKESVRRLSEVTIYHENFLRYQPDKTGEIFVPDRAIKLFQFLGSDRVHDPEGPEHGYSPVFIDIQLADWHRASINAQAFASFDIDLYFSLPTERSRRLYRFLEYIRYNHEVEIPYSKLMEELHIDRKLPTYKRAIKRALDPLVEKKFLSSCVLDSKVTVNFTEKKIITRKIAPLTTGQEAAVLRLMEATHEKNRKWAEFIIRTTPEHIVDRVMGETKMAVQEGRVIKTPGAYFSYFRKRIMHGDTAGNK